MALRVGWTRCKKCDAQTPNVGAGGTFGIKQCGFCKEFKHTKEELKAMNIWKCIHCKVLCRMYGPRLQCSNCLKVNLDETYEEKKKKRIALNKQRRIDLKEYNREMKEKKINL